MGKLYLNIMNLRILSKEHSIHIVIIGCMIMSWGVTCNYYESWVPNDTIRDITNFLLYPVKLTDLLLGLFFHTSISGNPLSIFFLLWMTYCIPAIKLYPIFMVQNHAVSDLRNWYNAKMAFSKQPVS